MSGDFFSTLGVTPLQGRLFTTADDRRGCGNLGAVISYEFWWSYFGGANSAIGGPLRIQDRLFTVIGVTPPEFFGLEVGQGVDVALPLVTSGWGREFCTCPARFAGRSDSCSAP